MIIITEKNIYSNYKNKSYATKAVNFLKERDLIPLKASPQLSMIAGHLMGDGSLSKDKYIGDFRFYGTKDKLKQIKLKIYETLKISPICFYGRKGGFVLRYNNCIISRVFYLMGVPRGNKVTNLFILPQWIKNGNRNIKQAFLRAICDDELSSPRIDKKGRIEPLRLKFNKNEKLINDGIKFLEDIRGMFIELGIKCNPIRVNNEKYINKDNLVSRSIYFNISSKKDNLVVFKKVVGFCNEKEKIYKLDNVLINH